MAKVETMSYTNEAFKTYLLQLSKDLVWKNSSLAKTYESNTDPYLVELYITANRGILNFDVIRAFPRVVLRAIGVNENDIDIYASDKTKIPTNMRKLAVEEYQKALSMINPNTGRNGYETPSGWVSVYEEQNDYYRMLNGLPSISDTKFVYNTDSRWPTDIPVHQLSLVDRLEMEDAGVLDKLIAKNPDAKYLKYCGTKIIDIYKARSSDRFDILWRASIESSTLEEDFDSVYKSCCNLVNSVYYSDAFKKTNSLYENFLAMCILFMTIQTMQYHYLSVDIIRDFYDTESLKYVYDSYSVPFYNEIPLEYHRKIVKNINRLIGYKGSSQVFFDLFDIFDTSMNIYTYYLTKVHRFDENGNPEFVLKTDEKGNPIYDKKGNPVLSSSNYDIAFSRGEIYQDPALSVADPVNKTDYESITVPDPYWVEDANIQKVLNESSFNFNETKYVGVQTTFDLIKIAYENAYLFKMIMDNKSITSILNVQWPDMGINADIYGIFIYLAALVCRYHGYDGLISDKLPYTSAVLGYDFKKSASIIKSNIENNQYLRSNTKLKEKIRNMNITNLNSVDSTFSNMRDIESMLISGFTDAKSRDEFYAYHDLYNTLMTSKIIDEVYTNKDGTVAESFIELLKNQCPDLYTRYISIADDAIENELTVLIDKLESLITSIKYSPHSLGIESSSLIDNLFRILRFFKSAKAEMIGYNVIYKITMRGINFIKIMDEWVYYKTHTQVKNDMYTYDFLTYMRSLLVFKNDLISLRDNDHMINETYNYLITEKINKIEDMLQIISEWHPPIEDMTEYIDFIIKSHYEYTLNEKQNQYDGLDMSDQFFPKGDPLMIFKDPFELLDFLVSSLAFFKINESQSFEDYLISIVEEVTEAIKMNKDAIISHDSLKGFDNTELYTIFEEYILKQAQAYYSGITINDKLTLIDKFLVYYQLIYNEYTNDNGIPGINNLFEHSAIYKNIIFDKHSQTDDLEMTDYVYEKSGVLASYKDIFNYIDKFIIHEGKQYMQSNNQLTDYINKVSTNVKTAIYMNHENLFGNDELIPNINRVELESIIDKYILKAVKISYFKVLINSNFNMSDMVKLIKTSYIIPDYSDAMISDYKLIMTIMMLKQVSNDKLSIQDSLTLSDGTPL